MGGEKHNLVPPKDGEDLCKSFQATQGISILKYLPALNSHPAVFICSSHPIFATKLILHWPRMKSCTGQELRTNSKAYMSLLTFLATAIPHLSRYPQAGPKLEVSRLASRPVFSSAKAELNGTSLHCSAGEMVPFFPPLDWEKPCEAPKRELDF